MWSTGVSEYVVGLSFSQGCAGLFMVITMKQAGRMLAKWRRLLVCSPRQLLMWHVWLLFLHHMVFSAAQDIFFPPTCYMHKAQTHIKPHIHMHALVSQIWGLHLQQWFSLKVKSESDKNSLILTAKYCTKEMLREDNDGCSGTLSKAYLCNYLKS